MAHRLHHGAWPLNLVTHDDFSLAQVALRAAVGTQEVEPDSSVALTTAPQYVEVHADRQMTGVYTALTDLQDKTLEKAVDKSPELFKKGSRGRALATCAYSGWSIAQTVSAQTPTETVAEQIDAAIGLGKEVNSQATDCVQALQAADEADLRAARISEDVLPSLESTPRATRVALLTEHMDAVAASVVGDLLRAAH